MGEVDDSPLDLAQTTGCILVSPHTPALGSGEVVSGCQLGSSLVDTRQQQLVPPSHIDGLSILCAYIYVHVDIYHVHNL